VFTEAILTEDNSQDLVWSRGMTNPMEYAKGLDERDFLNQQVLGGEKMEVGNSIEGRPAKTKVDFRNSLC
jgi:hypothetical protein